MTPRWVLLLASGALREAHLNLTRELAPKNTLKGSVLENLNFRIVRKQKGMITA
jgi:hypothetical protein